MSKKHNPFLKWYYRIMMLIILGAALAIPFFINNKQGEPMLSLPGLDGISSNSFVETKTTVYKWKDKNGTWQFGDTPPANTLFEELEISNHANLMPATPTTKTDKANSSPMIQNNDRALPQTTSEAISIDNAMHIVEDAQAVRNMMESRNKTLQDLNEAQ